MNNIKQEVIWYRNYEGADIIYGDMIKWIADGWRVHTCLNKSSDVIVVYEKEELTDNYLINLNHEDALVGNFNQPACINCPNNPNNGGNGICFCTLGQQITY